MEERGSETNLPGTPAELYAFIGEKGKALDCLEQEYKARDYNLADIRVEPLYDSLRSEKRFKDLLRRMHFPLPQ